jgi:protein-S-isoprenylcysteine O-methyltransferase Ste14
MKHFNSNESTLAPSRGSWLGLTYAGVGYLSFHASFGYLVLFVNDLLVPKSVEDGTPHALLSALAINFGLMVLWALQHSIMARRSFKQQLLRLVPGHLERATFVIASAAALFTVMLGWAPIEGSVWQVDNAIGSAALTGLGIAGWLLVVAASFEIDHFELLGLKQSVFAWRGKPLPEHEFQSKLIYRVVRHPIQTGLVFGMWCAPNLTGNRALFAALMTAYVLVGLFFEERDLIRQFGARYLQYRQEVPKLLPFSKGPRLAPMRSPARPPVRPSDATT